MNIWLAIAIAWLVMASVMTALWWLQRKTGDAGIVDAAWGLGVGGLAVFFAVIASSGNESRRFLIALLAMMWAVRLSGYILYRVFTMAEDGRYQTMKQQWAEQTDWRMFRFYQFQAMASLLFALPMLIAAQNPSPLSLLDWLAVAIWLIAIAGESIADWQLSKFRKQPTNKGQVCQAGLWNYSRHPNYFFEWLHWWSYVVLAIGAPCWWLTVLFPMAMLFFILRVTGIPPTEAQSIKSRGDAYRRYQQTTSPFFPWPPKKSNQVFQKNPVRGQP